MRSGWCAWCLLNVERYGVEEDEDEDDDVDAEDAKKNANSFLAFVCVCVRWEEDVCVQDVGRRERVVIGGRTCGKGRCTRV